MSGIEVEDMGRKRFFRYLLRQKWRERVLLRFFRRTFMTLAAHVIASLIKGRRRERPAAAPAMPAP